MSLERILFAVVLSACAGAGCDSGVKVIEIDPVAGPALTEDRTLNTEARQQVLALSRERAVEDYRIDSKDVLSIEVWQKDQPEIRHAVTVHADGHISFPLIGRVSVNGKSESEVEDAVRERVSKFIKEPFVSVRVTSVKSKKVYVFGEVRSPGILPLDDQLRVLDVVLAAGGLTENADLSRALFIRGQEALPVDFYALMREGAMENNIYVQSNDKVLVPNLADNKVFVFGEVQQPGVVFIDRELLLMDAVTACGGLTPEAKPSEVRIVRGTLADPRVYVTSINQLIAGNVQHNVPLERGDIVFVPAKGVVHWRRFMERVLPPLADVYLIKQLVNPPE